MASKNLLTESELRALRALARLSEGEAAFLNIPDADRLVELGLADRYGTGQFVLTDAGREFLEENGL